MTTDPLAFLTAALDAAQRDAEAASGAFPVWDWDDMAREVRDWDNAGTVAFLSVRPMYGPHIARHDPQATLRRIAADRKTLAACEEILAIDGWEYDDAPNLADATIRNLAEAWGWKEGEPP